MIGAVASLGHATLAAIAALGWNALFAASKLRHM